MHTIESTSPSWSKSTLSQVIQWTEAKVRVYSDSVLHLVKMCDNRDAITRWAGPVKEFKMWASYKELLGIDGEPIDSSAIFSQDFRHCRFFRKSRVICDNDTLNLKNSQTRSSACHCRTTSIGQEKETMESVFRIQKKSRNTQRDSRKDTGRSSVLETKRSGMELSLVHLEENGTLQPLKWWNVSQILIIQYSRVSVL